jgi:hypothetical protein
MLEELVELGGGPLFVLAFVSLFLVVGVIVFVGGLAYLRKYLVLKRTTPTDALEVASGAVEVEGEVIAGEETVEAPLSGTECVAYEVEAERHSSSESGGKWRTEAEASEYVPFRLHDGTGTLGVEPTGSSLSLDRQYREVVEANEEPPENIRAFLEDTDQLDLQKHPDDSGVGPLVRGSTYRFTERRIEPETEAFVAGTADSMTAVAGDSPTITGTDEGTMRNALADPFVVSNRDEAATQRRFAFVGVGMLVLGGMFSWIPLVLFFSVLG